MTLNPVCEHVETAQGVPLTVTGVAQCKIMTAKELLTTASEQFLGKTSQEVQLTILQTLEGHLRAILGTLSVEEVRAISLNPVDNETTGKENKKVSRREPQNSPSNGRRSDKRRKRALMMAKTMVSWSLMSRLTMALKTFWRYEMM